MDTWTFMDRGRRPIRVRRIRRVRSERRFLHDFDGRNRHVDNRLAGRAARFLAGRGVGNSQHLLALRTGDVDRHRFLAVADGLR